MPVNPIPQSDEAELKGQVTDIVLQILNRGRLNQQEIEGKLTVRDMGINYRKQRFTQQIMHLIHRHNIERDKQHQAIYDWLLGKSGDFPESEPGKRYGWRTELRKRVATLQSELNKLEEKEQS